MTKTERKPYIFLDFDGVLNSFEEGSYMTNSSETYGPSKKICSLIKNLCDRTGAKIIITSNWRKFEENGSYSFNGNKVFNPLRKVKELLGDYIIGTLPPLRHVLKSEALIIWIEENDFDYNNEKWVVLDDDSREGFGSTYDCKIRDHYIQTDAEFGITEDIIKEIDRRFSAV